MLRRLRSIPGYVYIIAPVSVLVLGLLSAQISEIRPEADRRIGLGFNEEMDPLLVRYVEPGDPAHRADLRVGDLLLEIDGRPVADVDDYDAAAATFQKNVGVAFLVERGGGRQELTVHPGIAPDWSLSLWTAAAVLFCLIGGAVCAAGRTEDSRAKLLAAAFFLIAIEFSLPGGIETASPWRVIGAFAFYILTGAQIAIELHLASVIPRASVRTPRHRAFIAGCYVAGSAIAVIGSLAYALERLAFPRLPVSPDQIDGLILDLVFPAWALGMMGLLVNAMVRATSRRGRFQAGFVLIGVVPWSVYTLVDWARGYPADVSPMFAQLLPFFVLFYPVAMFIAIFRYRLFGLPVLVQRSLIYTGLTSALVLVFYSALGAGGAVFSRVLQGEQASIWSASIATLVLGLMFAPLRKTLRRFIERRFHPERTALRRRLIDLASELPALGKLDRMGQHLVRGLRQIFRTHSVTLLLTEPSSGALYRLACSPSSNDAPANAFLLAEDDRVIQRLRTAGRPMPGWDVLSASPAWRAKLGRKRVQLAVPLLREQRLIGVLVMGRRITREDFTAEERELLVLVAHQVASVLENVRLFQSATYEGLTGLLRREAALEILEAEVDRARRYDRPLTVALADIDHFKTINDRYGHLEGDRVLRAVSEALRSVIRASDDIGRYGGEEFLLVFPETDLQAAGVLSEKLRRTIEQLELTTDDGESIEVRVSIGMASLSPLGAAGDSESCIRAADQELYRAKAAGRNRVEPQPCNAEADLHDPVLTWSS